MTCAPTDIHAEGSSRGQTQPGGEYPRELRRPSLSDSQNFRTQPWRLPPMEWILAHWKPGQPHATPGRVLVAGCGTGAEAFVLSQRFPDAEIVAVDFSARSIAIARQHQQRARYRRHVRFVLADFSAPELDRMIGKDFDFVVLPRRAQLCAPPQPGTPEPVSLSLTRRCPLPRRQRNAACQRGAPRRCFPPSGWR